MKGIYLLPLAALLAQCRSVPDEGTDGTTTVPGRSGELQQIINVSAYDPKERQREGNSFSQHDVSALAANGSRGLIARAGKGGKLDQKCADFVASADKAGMLPGLYYRVQKHVSPVTQANQFVDRAEALARGRRWNAPAMLLSGDYDGDLPLSSILAFMDRVEQRTGVVPIAYLENSQALKEQTSRADRQTKARIGRAPYWLALYSTKSGSGPVYPAPGNPENLVKQYNLWPNWTMWQYGGVEWTDGKSKPKVFSNGTYPNSTYFGNLDRPTERNVFRGSQSDLTALWQKHGIAL
ncbi:GH25 family lysozyme [Verrucomicrobiales bacterium]|jgi:GH25 family lysozyme M1 (1,4-beta-N-acetylmuramidase)|nr:GH25 family lysozyme [Verrucomicrobiales bacterium]